MAAPTYTHDLVDWIADNDTTAWGELTGAAGGALPDEADTESALQGTNTVSQATAATTACGMGRVLATPVTFTAGQVALVWHGHGVGTALQTYVNHGLQVAIIGTTLANWKAYTVGGYDVAPFPYGKWSNNPVDPTLTADTSNGTPPTGGTSIYGIGSICTLTQPVSKGQPHVCDMIRYGRAEARFAGGDLANGYATFTGFATANDALTARWGLIQSVQGGYQWKGLMTLGFGGVVDFRDSNKSIFIQDTRKVTASFNAIEIRNVASNVEWNGISITALGIVSKGTMTVIDNAVVALISCNFIDMDAFTFQTNTTITGTTFRRCGLVTPTGCTISSSQFDKASGVTAITVTGAQLSTISSTEFISSGTGHGVTITGTAGTWSLNGLTFTGYAGTNGTTGNEAIFVNIATGAVVLNITNGGSTPSIRTAGATVTVNNARTLTLTGLIAGSRVAVISTNATSDNYDDDTEVAGTTNSGTSFTYDYNWTGVATIVNIKVIHSTKGMIELSNISLGANGVTLPIQPTTDRQYQNPA